MVDEAARPGKTLLGKYRVERVLGEGGMGVVIAARHIDLGELFAIKLLRREAIYDARTASRFIHEARAAARLTSDHVAKVHDVGRLESGRPYMVMEYLEGSDLSQIMKSRGALPFEDAALLVLQACDAIAEAHALGIVHRDIKLANLFLTRRRNGKTCLKVLDFGISKQTNLDDPLTRPGVMLGSPYSMSPEQLADPKAVDGRSDIWAMGVVLYELTTGRAPFDGNSLPELIKNVLTFVPEPPSRVRRELPATLDEVITRCLCKSPAGRYASIEELAAAVRSIVGWAGEQPPKAEMQQSVPMGREPTGDRQPDPSITTPLEKPRVFISCRVDIEEDLETASSFYEALAAAGATPFLAPKNIKKGEHWVRAVSEAMRGCDAFLLLLSRWAAVSELVAGELDLARQLGQSNAGIPYIVPVRVCFPEDVATSYPLQEPLQELKHVVWNGPDDTPAVVKALLERIEHQDPGHSTADDEQAPPANAAPQRPTHPAFLWTPPELPGGIVSAKSPYYVVRPSIEDACLREVINPGALIRIKGPRQMGKSSLMMRLLDDAAEAHVQTVPINLQMADSAILGDLNRFLRWLCAVISRRLKIPSGRIDDAWDDIFGAKDNCTAYFEEHLLTEGDMLVLALDHVDRVFQSPGTAEEFLALLRAWHEMGKSQELWGRLRMVLVYSTEMYLPMSINHSPFNVGLPVVLSEWDADIVHELARRHGLAMDRADVDRLMGLVGGHPHLVRIALYHVANGMRLVDVLATAATDQGLFADHLKHLQWHVQSRPELAEAAGRVMAAAEPSRLSTEMAFKLVSLGLVHSHDDQVRPACELYRRYLTARLPAHG